MKRRFVLVLFACVIALGAAYTNISAASFQTVGEDSKIDWTNHIYIARGEGVMPSRDEEPNRARALLKAKGYAKMQALANMLMLIEGTAIDYQSTGKDFMANEVIKQRIQGFIRNVKVAGYSEHKVEGDTVIVAEMHAPMFSENGPADVFLGQMGSDSGYTLSAPKVMTKKDITGKDDVKPATELAQTASAKPSEPGKPYTSLIIDATGYKIDRCMSPKIRTLDGAEVWGTVSVDMDFLQDHGIVAYVMSMAEAKKNSRAGSNPMFVKAIGRAGGKFYSDPCVSYPDAELIKSEAAKGDFLKKFNVIFIKDGKL